MANIKTIDLPDSAPIDGSETLVGNQGANTVKIPVTEFATAAQGAKADSALQPEQNLADLDNASDARDNLGLGNVAVEDADVEPGADLIPKATDKGTIKSAWVDSLDYKLDQLLAQQWANKWPGIPAPAFYQEFGGGASLLDPRITFTRASDSWYFKDGVLVKADVNEPVFENGAQRLEPSATNLFGYSSNFESASTKDNCTIEFIDDDPLFPNGYSKVTDDSTSDRHGFRDSRGRSTTDNPVLIRYLVRPWGGLRYIAFGQALPTSASNTAILDTDTGAVTSSISSGIYGAIYRGSGWWEVYFQYPSLQSAGGNGYASLYCSAGPIYSNTIYSGTGTQGFLVAAAQATELLSIDNSFIFTNGTNVTRAADNFSIVGQDFADVFNPNEGAIVLEVDDIGIVPSVYAYIFDINDGTTTNRFGARIATATGNLEFARSATTGGGSGSSSSPIALNAHNKIAVCWKPGEGYAAGFLNGEKVFEFPNDVFDISFLDRFMLARFGSSAQRARLLCKNLMLFKYCPSDAQLEALTSND